MRGFSGLPFSGRSTAAEVRGTEKVVRVTWHDAFADVNGWTTVADVDDAPCEVVSVGFLLEGAKHGHIAIAQSRNDHDSVDSVLFVPVEMVRAIQILC
jgi:hypothetical protein